MPNPKFRVIVDVEVDANTTRLSAEEHAEQVCESIRRTVGHGLLTAHEPQAEIVEYSISMADSQ